AVDADRLAHARGDLFGQRCEARLALGLGREMRDLLAREQPFEAEDVDAHARGFSHARAIVFGYSESSTGSSHATSASPLNASRNCASGRCTKEPTRARQPPGVVPGASAADQRPARR